MPEGWTASDTFWVAVSAVAVLAAAGSVSYLFYEKFGYVAAFGAGVAVGVVGGVALRS